MTIFNQGREYVLGLFRMVIGILFVCHGAANLFGILGSPRAVQFGAWPSWWASMIQLVGGAAVAFGLGTRLAALLCSGSMAYAYFVTHQPTALLPIQNKGEAAALFCWTFLLIAFVGPGRWALSSIFERRAEEQADAEPVRTDIIGG